MGNKDYTVSELVQDPAFRRMVKGTAAPYEIDRWSKWMEASNQNRQKARLAMSEIAGFEFADPTIPDVDEAWSRLYSVTVGGRDIPHLKMSEKDSSLRWMYRAAAAILLIGMVSIGGYLYSESDQAATQLEQITEERQVETGEGEQKSLKFSNGAKIVLNSNSVLTYTIGLLGDETIQVTLEGEAYFEADMYSSSSQPAFAVSTPDGIIEDIGTKFLVTVEKGHSRVILQEGLVEVEQGDARNSNGIFRVSMGEMVEFDKAHIIKREAVNSTFYTSWATGFIEFNQTEIKEFATYVEQRFGVKVQIMNPDIAGIAMDGAVYFKSLEDLVRSVSDVVKISVYQSEDRNTIYIGNHQQ